MFAPQFPCLPIDANVMRSLWATEQSLSRDQRILWFGASSPALCRTLQISVWWWLRHIHTGGRVTRDTCFYPTKCAQFSFQQVSALNRTRRDQKYWRENLGIGTFGRTTASPRSDLIAFSETTLWKTQWLLWYNQFFEKHKPPKHHCHIQSFTSRLECDFIRFSRVTVKNLTTDESKGSAFRPVFATVPILMFSCSRWPLWILCRSSRLYSGRKNMSTPFSERSMAIQIMDWR
jgi:hypothetical protein